MSSIEYGNDQPLYNSRIFRNYIGLVAHKYKDVNLDDVLKYAGMELFQVEDDGHWFTQKQINLFHEKLSSLTHENISWEAGRYTTSPDSLGILRQYTLSMMGLSAVFGNVGKWSKKFSRASLYASRKLTPNKVELTVTPNSGVQEEPFQCLNRLGYIEGFASLFNMKPPEIKHPECLFQGGSSCRYIVSWEETLSGLLSKISNALYLALFVFCIFSPLLFSVQTALTVVLPFSMLTGLAAGLYTEKIKSREMQDAMAEISLSSDQQMGQVSTNYDNSLLINEICQSLNNEQDLNGALKEIILIMQKRLQYDRGLILLANHERTKLTFLYSYGYTKKQEEFLKQTNFELNNPTALSIFSQAFITKKPISLSDISKLEYDPSSANYAYINKLDPVSVICSPILHEKEPVGILAVDNYSREKRLYQRDINLLTEISSQIGSRIHNIMLQKRLQQTQKMEAVGSLAGGVAHDFNNILTTILGYSELTLKKLTNDDPLYENIEAIYSAGERASKLTRQLLAFSRKQVMEMQVNSLNTLVDEMAKILKKLIGDDVEMKLKLAKSIGNIMADASHIEQILLNLVVNARDAMPAGGKLIIETSETVVNAEDHLYHKGMPPGAYAQLTITDTGEGMSDSIRERIFEPFFTTKPVYRGTGLGLSTVYGIVKQHKGFIDTYSEIGIGTTFKVYFPIINKKVESKTPKDIRHLAEGSATILVVDDNPAILDLTQIALEPLGYKVLKAPNGQKALELSRTLDEGIELLLTDVVMPGMSGRQLISMMRKERPGLKAILMSGYPADIVSKSSNLEQDFAFISKPFAPIGLSNKIKEVLDTQNGKKKKAEIPG